MRIRKLNVKWKYNIGVAQGNLEVFSSWVYLNAYQRDGRVFDSTDFTNSLRLFRSLK